MPVGGSRDAEAAAGPAPDAFAVAKGDGYRLKDRELYRPAPPKTVGRGRSDPRHVGGSWAERPETAIDRSPVAPGHITPRSQPQSQMLRS
jgi:hypothetical protein